MLFFKRFGRILLSYTLFGISYLIMSLLMLVVYSEYLYRWIPDQAGFFLESRRASVENCVYDVVENCVVGSYHYRWSAVFTESTMGEIDDIVFDVLG